MISVSTGNTKARPHEIIEDVWFGDVGNPYQSEGYTFTAGPVPDLLSAYLIDDDGEFTIKAKTNWLRDGFTEEDWDEIQERLKDPEDPLRAIHVYEMFNVLVAEVSKRPFTSSSASSGTRRRNTGAAKPKAKASTSGE